MPADTVSAETRQVHSAAYMVKQATATLHRELDHHALVQTLLRPPIDAFDYARLMRAFHRSYSLLEPKLLEYERRHPAEHAYEARLPHFTPIIDAGHETCVAEETQLGAAQYWGCRYVLDGSSHGAGILLPRLQKQLGPMHPSLSYWQLLKRQRQHWPWLVTQMQNYASAGGEMAELTMAAKHCFQCFIDALDQELAH